MRPWKLASETVTLNHLSNGRVILAVGLGAVDTGFEEFGEVTDRRARAELLDESLEILTLLWKAKPFDFDGNHYHVHLKEIGGPLGAPPPVQQPRIPIWVVGAWPRSKSMARDLRYDGLLPNMMAKTVKSGFHSPRRPNYATWPHSFMPTDPLQHRLTSLWRGKPQVTTRSRQSPWCAHTRRLAPHGGTRRCGMPRTITQCWRASARVNPGLDEIRSIDVFNPITQQPNRAIKAYAIMNS
jgi:Luciferase-like monooxygenase